MGISTSSLNSGHEPVIFSSPLPPLVSKGGNDETCVNNENKNVSPPCQSTVIQMSNETPSTIQTKITQPKSALRKKSSIQGRQHALKFRVETNSKEKPKDEDQRMEVEVQASTSPDFHAQRISISAKADEKTSFESCSQQQGSFNQSSFPFSIVHPYYDQVHYCSKYFQYNKELKHSNSSSSSRALSSTLVPPTPPLSRILIYFRINDPLYLSSSKGGFLSNLRVKHSQSTSNKQNKLEMTLKPSSGHNYAHPDSHPDSPQSSCGTTSLDNNVQNTPQASIALKLTKNTLPVGKKRDCCFDCFEFTVTPSNPKSPSGRAISTNDDATLDNNITVARRRETTHPSSIQNKRKTKNQEQGLGVTASPPVCQMRSGCGHAHPYQERLVCADSSTFRDATNMPQTCQSLPKEKAYSKSVFSSTSSSSSSSSSSSPLFLCSFSPPYLSGNEILSPSLDLISPFSLQNSHLRKKKNSSVFRFSLLVPATCLGRFLYFRILKEMDKRGLLTAVVNPKEPWKKPRLRLICNSRQQQDQHNCQPVPHSKESRLGDGETKIDKVEPLSQEDRLEDSGDDQNALHLQLSSNSLVVDERDKRQQRSVSMRVLDKTCASPVGDPLSPPPHKKPFILTDDIVLCKDGARFELVFI